MNPELPSIPLQPMTRQQEIEVRKHLKKHAQKYRNTHPDHFRSEDERKEYGRENGERRQGEDRW